MPCDYSTYPPNWKSEIRPDILTRDNNACKFCGLPNHSTGFRQSNGDFQPYEPTLDFHEAKKIAKAVGLRLIKIVLTIAHLDHDNTNNDYDNLAALCQRCHILHDKDQHAANAKATNQKKKKQTTLF